MTKRQLTPDQEERARRLFESQAIEGSHLTLDQMREIVLQGDDEEREELPIREGLRRMAEEQGVSYLDLLRDYDARTRPRGNG